MYIIANFIQSYVVSEVGYLLYITYLNYDTVVVMIMYYVYIAGGLKFQG